MKVVIPPLKKRPAGHKALFDQTQPYRPKKEKRKDQYKRQFKNNRDSQQQGLNDI